MAGPLANGSAPVLLVSPPMLTVMFWLPVVASAGTEKTAA
jgi:hypothetical protein